MFSKLGTVVIYSLKSNKAQFSPAGPLSAEEKDELEVRCAAGYAKLGTTSPNLYECM